MTNKIHYAIQPAITIPQFLRKDIISKLAYIDERIAHVAMDTTGTLDFQLHKAATPEEEAALHQKVQRAIELLVTTTKEPTINVVENHMDRPVPCTTDPMPILQASGEIVHTGEGLFSLGPLAASLCRYFETQLFQLGLAQGAQIYRFPTMIPAGFLEKIQYFKNFPHSLSFAIHLREDLDVIEQFAAQTHCLEGEIHAPPNSFANIRHTLAPTICHNFYLYLANRTLPQDPMIATAQGNCFRYESINMHSLERLWNFSMWEVIFVGSAPQVKAALNTASQAASRLVQEWGLAYRLENANDPFFIREFGTQAGFQNIYDLKYEYRARLPFKEGTVAVGSRNYHMDFFGRHMQIKLASGTFAHSGCIGFGLERLAFAYLSQYGTDPKQWTEPVRSGIKHMNML